MTYRPSFGLCVFRSLWRNAYTKTCVSTLGRFLLLLFSLYNEYSNNLSSIAFNAPPPPHPPPPPPPLAKAMPLQAPHTALVPTEGSVTLTVRAAAPPGPADGPEPHGGGGGPQKRCGRPPTRCPRPRGRSIPNTNVYTYIPLSLYIYVYMYIFVLHTHMYMHI